MIRSFNHSHCSMILAMMLSIWGFLPPLFAQSPNSIPAANPAPAVTPEPEKHASHPITISGRVLDENGHPLANATVYLTSQYVDWKRLAEVKSGTDGRFEFKGIPLPVSTPENARDPVVGRFEIFAVAPGHGFGWRPARFYYKTPPQGVRREDVITADPPAWFVGDEPIELDITLTEPHTLHGQVTDATGAPIAGATLAIRYADKHLQLENWNRVQDDFHFESLNQSADVPPEVKLRKTGADGRFEFTDLPAGTRFHIDVRPPGFQYRQIWAVTSEVAPAEFRGQPIHRDGMTVVFRKPRDFQFRVIYADSKLPAPRMRLGGGNSDGMTAKFTDNQGLATLQLTEGENQFELLPAINTPYLISNAALTLKADTQQPITLELPPASVVTVSALHAESGMGIEGYSLVIKTVSPQGQLLDWPDHFRNTDADKRIAHVHRPRTDASGKLEFLFQPGEFEVTLQANTTASQQFSQIEPATQRIKTRLGEPGRLEFKVR